MDPSARSLFCGGSRKGATTDMKEVLGANCRQEGERNTAMRLVTEMS